MELTIDLLRKLSNDDTMMVTQHAEMRCRLRGIRLDDIQSAIRTGEIIESYPDDFPHPSCLVSGTDCRELPLHVVAGASKETLWIITAYQPSIQKWKNDFKTRKAANE